MRVLVADPNSNSQNYAINKLSNINSVKVVGSYGDLTATFNAVEHQPPSLVLIAPSLTKDPAFEMMEVLFKCLSVRWMPFGNIKDYTPATAQLSTGSTNGFLNIALDPDEIEAELTRKRRRPPVIAPSAPAGLFRSSPRMALEKIVLIGSSTGGIDALIRVLGSFPSDCPPTIVVQHTGGAFSGGLARLLNQRVEPTVCEAKDGDQPSQGTVLIAPGDEKHLVLDTKFGVRCRLHANPKLSGHRPSVDALFRSAVPIAKQITATILTGMGKDGAEGMLELRHAGAQTIGQDKETSVVYGMPGHAAKIGAVKYSLPLVKIGPAILRSLQRAEI